MNNEDIKKLLAAGESHIVKYDKGKTIETMEVTANFEQFAADEELKNSEGFITPIGARPHAETNKANGLVSVWKMKRHNPDSYGWRRLAYDKIIAIDGQEL